MFSTESTFRSPKHHENGAICKQTSTSSVRTDHVIRIPWISQNVAQNGLLWIRTGMRSQEWKAFKQQLNEKWDVGYLSAFGWTVLLRYFGVQCLCGWGGGGGGRYSCLVRHAQLIGRVLFSLLFEVRVGFVSYFGAQARWRPTGDRDNARHF